MEISDDKIVIVPNGINDFGTLFSEKISKKKSDTFQCLFVGVLSESKGIFFILEALRKVKTQGYSVCLNMAGYYSQKVYKRIKEQYGDLPVNLLGRISFEELKRYYLESDIGIIASLQEQCSYVGIEMAMFGLPVITTAVDGLDEMFTDGVDALKVDTKFSKVFGLGVDTDMLAEKIIALINDESLRKQLGINARKLYLRRFTLERMMEETVRVYQDLIDESLKNESEV